MIGDKEKRMGKWLLLLWLLVILIAIGGIVWGLVVLWRLFF